MKYASLTWEGALIGPETLDALNDENALKGQKPGDFGFKAKVRDEILEAWAEAKAQWLVFKIRRDKDDARDGYGTTRTRQSWVLPFLSLLGYELENAQAVELGGRSFAVSHRAAGYACPVHIVGFNESLDTRRDGARSSPHSLLQEYINLSESLYALVTNGLSLRLLRDSSRLVKLSYLEFNLERMFEEELFADFALLFRLLHISRWPRQADEAADCLLEHFHQDSLEKGSAIRNRLSAAVKEAIEDHWAQAFSIIRTTSRYAMPWLPVRRTRVACTTPCLPWCTASSSCSSLKSATLRIRKVPIRNSGPCTVIIILCRPCARAAGPYASRMPDTATCG